MSSSIMKVLFRDIRKDQSESSGSETMDALSDGCLSGEVGSISRTNNDNYFEEEGGIGEN